MEIYRLPFFPTVDATLISYIGITPCEDVDISPLNFPYYLYSKFITFIYL